MHPYLSAEMAAAHAADLVREAAETCCRALTVRHPVLDRLRAATQRATEMLHRATTRSAPSCCPA